MAAGARRRVLDAANFRFEHARGVVYGYLSERGVRTLLLPNPEAPMRPHMLHSTPNHVLGRRLHDALARYFAGQREAFAGIELDFESGTPFQRAVWEAACATPWGETSTYGELAKRMGKAAGASRAIGAALGANPVHVLVPCHRYVAANGSLVNYAAGLEWKQHLLGVEGATLV